MQIDIDLVQTIAIVVGFLVTFVQLRATSQLTRFDIFWRVGDSHRDVWQPMIDNPAFARLLDLDPNLGQVPISHQERRFAISVILHIENVFRSEQAGYYRITAPEEMDIAELLSYPILRSVWNECRDFQSPNFVEFMERALDSRSRGISLAKKTKEESKNE
jgi:hypothetical protein